MNSKLLRATFVVGLSAIVAVSNSQGVAQHDQSNQTNQSTPGTTKASRSKLSKLYAVPLPKPNEENRILKMTNLLRKQKGKPVFVRNNRLDKAAHDHAMNMAKQGTMNHLLDGKPPSDRIKSTGYGFHTFGENIANAWGQPDNTNAMFNFWLKSPPHLANMLGPFTDVGIGVAVSDSGRYYSCQVFAVPVRGAVQTVRIQKHRIAVKTVRMATGMGGRTQFFDDTTPGASEGHRRIQSDTRSWKRSVKPRFLNVPRNDVESTEAPF